jgi:hypothetical protein
MEDSKGACAGAALMLSAAKRHMYKHLRAAIRPSGEGIPRFGFTNGDR